MRRRANLGDLEAIYRIEAVCFKEHRFRREHLQWILTNEHVVTVVEDGAPGLLGAVMLLIDGKVGRVLSIAVIPEVRRTGLGTELMRAAERIAAEHHCDFVRLEVSTENAGALQFYRKLGYEVDGFLPGYYSWGDDAHSMRKRLAMIPTARAPTNA